MNLLRVCIFAFATGIGFFLQAQPVFLAVSSKGQGSIQQRCFQENHFPDSLLQEALADGFFLQDISYGDQHWVLVLTKNESISLQHQLSSSEFPEDSLAYYREQGFLLASLAYGDGQWRAVVNEEQKHFPQFFKLDSLLNLDWLKEQAEAGFFLSDVASDHQGFYLVMGKVPGYTRQTVFFGAQFPAQALQDLLVDPQYRLSHLSYQRNQWIAVVTEGSGLGSQQWYVKAAIPQHFIEESWASGLAITQLQRVKLGQEMPANPDELTAKSSPMKRDDKARCPVISKVAPINDLAEEMYKLKSDAEKADLATQRIPELNACLQVRHVHYLAQLMDEESSLWEWTKFAYDYTADRENYKELRALFEGEKYLKNFDKLISSP